LADLELNLISRYDDPPPKNKIEAFWAWLVRENILYK
jgi:hypothetical protein